MTGYKLTNKDMQTFGAFQWMLGTWVETSGEGSLCSDGWLHYYRDPLLAVLHNPIHGDFSNYRLFECEADGKTKHDRWMKSGATRLRLTKEIAVPQITETQRIAYGILAAMEVCDDEGWRKWAAIWLSGEDRTHEAAAAAEEATWAATWAARAAEEATWAATWAARVAAGAAWAAAARATWAAARAAAAAAAWKDINLPQIAKKAMEVE